jgi:hypothetical protein
LGSARCYGGRDCTHPGLLAGRVSLCSVCVIRTRVGNRLAYSSDRSRLERRCTQQEGSLSLGGNRDSRHVVAAIPLFASHPNGVWIIESVLAVLSLLCRYIRYIQNGFIRYGGEQHVEKQE